MTHYLEPVLTDLRKFRDAAAADLKITTAQLINEQVLKVKLQIEADHIKHGEAA